MCASGGSSSAQPLTPGFSMQPDEAVKRDIKGAAAPRFRLRWPGSAPPRHRSEIKGRAVGVRAWASAPVTAQRRAPVSSGRLGYT